MQHLAPAAPVASPTPRRSFEPRRRSGAGRRAAAAPAVTKEPERWYWTKTSPSLGRQGIVGNASRDLAVRHCPSKQARFWAVAHSQLWRGVSVCYLCSKGDLGFL